MRVTFRMPQAEALHWLSFGGVSVFIHATALVASLWLPRLLASPPRLAGVYTVDLVSLPAGPPGPPTEGPRASAPAPAPPAPSKPQPAIKIPEKPTKPKSEPVIKKPAPPKAKPKTEEKSPVQTKAPPTVEAPPSAGGSQPTGTGDASSTGAAGGGGGTPGGTGGGGGSGFVDPSDFEYAWYLQRIQSVVQLNWARPLDTSERRQTLSATVRFEIRRDGNLMNIQLERPSGDSALDRSALRAVQDSNPLPPLPYGYGKASMGIRLEFELEIPQ